MALVIRVLILRDQGSTFMTTFNLHGLPPWPHHQTQPPWRLRLQYTNLEGRQKHSIMMESMTKLASMGQILASLLQRKNP